MSFADFDHIAEQPLDALADRCRKRGVELLMNPFPSTQDERDGYLFLLVARAFNELAKPNLEPKP